MREYQRLLMNPEMYEPRITRGGGEVRDLMPWPEAIAYVQEDLPGNVGRFGVLYHLQDTCRQCGEDGSDRYRIHIDWLGNSLEEAFGEGVKILGLED